MSAIPASVAWHTPDPDWPNRMPLPVPPKNSAPEVSTRNRLADAYTGASTTAVAALSTDDTSASDTASQQGLTRFQRDRRPAKRAPYVIVGLSGGVDSAVAAARLLAMGCRVEGLFMKNWDDDTDNATTSQCSAAEDYAAARSVAEHLDIVLHKRNFSSAYRERVFAHFLAEHRAGRTPNPDVLCNREVKFGPFLEQARALGADFVATGHYARLLDGPAGSELVRARDDHKDQTYFLHALNQHQLARALFPLGDLIKPDVRKIAAALALPNHARRDSTGICFIGERDMRNFLSRYIETQSGPIKTPDGQIIGEHPGLCFFTLGQRQGLGIGGVQGHSEAPWYVIEKQPGNNTLVVAQDAQHPRLMTAALTTETFHWIATQPPTHDCRDLQVRLRHRGPLVAVRSWKIQANGGLRIELADAQRAVAPGQSAVIYRAARCLGGGVIDGIETDAD
ncbi:MAG: tRNA 2-thiouridine(34) synthase MnmA [Thioalkalivibrionaceae bacterium]